MVKQDSDKREDPPRAQSGGGEGDDAYKDAYKDKRAEGAQSGGTRGRESQAYGAAYHDPAPFAVEAAGHSFRFLPGGPERLAALLEMIAAARRSLALCYYMFEDDASGRAVRDALVAAAERGVVVQLIFDSFGTSADEAFFAPIRDAGGAVSVFNPRWTVRYLIRNHQKFVIADEAQVMMGGANIAEAYFAPPGDAAWCDLSVIVSGAVVADFARWFAALYGWSISPKPRLRAVRELVRDWEPGEGAVQLLLGGPTRAPSNWARRIKEDMISAHWLDLVMAYFSPPLSYRRLMRRIARRGRARLIMPSKSDNGATIGAARLLYGGFLRAGARLYEFLPSKLHMKLAVIDDIAYFGSANFDMRSVRVNLETMLRVESAELAAALRAMTDHLERGSIPITKARYKAMKGPLHALQWRLSWALVVTLDYTVSRRVNAGL